MSRAGSRALVGSATLVVASATISAMSVADWVVAGSCLLCGIAVAVGWVIVRHEPSSPVGPALAWTTACVAFVTGHVGPLATVPWASGFWPVNLAGLLALLLVFPSRPPAGRGWRAVPWAFGAATVGMVAAQWGPPRSTAA